MIPAQQPSSSNEANSTCVGPQSEMAGRASSCAGCPNQGACSSGEAKTDPALALVQDRMSLVKHKILVLSGKGGVGKSTFSAQLAFSLAQQGKQVGLLDVDICGPSIPRMLGLEGHEVHQSASGWSPVYVEDNLGVMSIGFMLPQRDDAIIWRGPRKNGIIKQFLTDVNWNELDYLIVDTPPGTSDEHISIVQYLKTSNIDGAIVVTTPQEVSMADVRKELNFCRKTGISVLGIVENMADIKLPLSSIGQPLSGIRFVNNEGTDITQNTLELIRLRCPELLQVNLESDLFRLPESTSSGEQSNTPEAMARSFIVPYFGKLPMDPNMMRACEEGKSFLEAYPHSPAARPFAEVVRRLLEATV
jgi:Mrp family chromosome partitioning ATPase